MLVLERRVGQKVYLTVPPHSAPIVIVVDISRVSFDSKGKGVKFALGFDAPREVTILRSEVLNRESPDDAAAESAIAERRAAS